MRSILLAARPSSGSCCRLRRGSRAINSPARPCHAAQAQRRLPPVARSVPFYSLRHRRHRWACPPPSLSWNRLAAGGRQRQVISLSSSSSPPVQQYQSPTTTSSSSPSSSSPSSENESDAHAAGQVFGRVWAPLNAYRILEVPQDASSLDIRKAHRAKTAAPLPSSAFSSATRTAYEQILEGASAILSADGPRNAYDIELEEDPAEAQIVEVGEAQLAAVVVLLNASRDYDNALKVGGAALARLQDRCIGGSAAPPSEQALVAVEELRRDLRLSLAITHCDIARDTLGETDDEDIANNAAEAKEREPKKHGQQGMGETLLKSAAALDMAASCLESAAYDPNVVFPRSSLSEGAKQVLTAPLAPDLLEEIETSLEMLAPFVALQQLALPLEDLRRASAFKEMPGIITFASKSFQQPGGSPAGGHVVIANNEQYFIPPLILQEKHEFAEKALLSMTAAEVTRIIPWEKIGQSSYDDFDGSWMSLGEGTAEYGPPSSTFLTIGGLAHLFLATETREPTHLILADRLFELAEMRGANVQIERLVVTFLAGQVEAATELLDTIEQTAATDMPKELPAIVEGEDADNRDLVKKNKNAPILTVLSPRFRNFPREAESDDRIQHALDHIRDKGYRHALSKHLMEAIQSSSGGFDETLPGLCVVATRFINRTALLSFRSTSSYRREFSLTDWFDDSKVQNFAVNAVQSFSQTPDPDTVTSPSQFARIGGVMQSLAMSIAQFTARLFLPFLRLAQWVVSATSGNNNRRRPRYLRGSNGLEKKRNAMSDILSVVLGVVMMVVCAIGGIFVLNKTVETFGPRIKATMTKTVELSRQSALNNMVETETSGLSRIAAERIVRGWQHAKAQAMGPSHKIAPLEQYLGGGCLRDWQRKVIEAKAGRWHWDYELKDLRILGKPKLSPDGREAIVDVELFERASLVSKLSPADNTAYQDRYRTRYTIVNVGGHSAGDNWRIYKIDLYKP